MLTYALFNSFFKVKHFNPIVRYTVYKPSSRHQREKRKKKKTNWNESSRLCSLNNSQLVSIEDEKELNFLEEKLERKRYPSIEYLLA